MLVYNQRQEQLDLTKQALASLLSQDVGPLDVVVIDNGSVDGILTGGTREWLDSIREPNFTVAYYPKNVSPCKVTNVWLGRLFEDHDDVLGVANDVILPPNLYRKMLEFPQGIVAAGMHGVNPPVIMEEVKRVHGNVHLSVPLIRRWAYDDLIAKDGHFFDEYIEGSNPQKGYFMYASDCDLKVRLVEAGISTAQLDILCWHYGGASHRLGLHSEARAAYAQADLDRDYFYRKWGYPIASPEYAAVEAKISI
jgi:GT2 family glycosyltransferase